MDRWRVCWSEATVITRAGALWRSWSTTPPPWSWTPPESLRRGGPPPVGTTAADRMADYAHGNRSIPEGVRARGELHLAQHRPPGTASPQGRPGIGRGGAVEAPPGAARQLRPVLRGPLPAAPGAGAGAGSPRRRDRPGQQRLLRAAPGRQRAGPWPGRRGGGPSQRLPVGHPAMAVVARPRGGGPHAPAAGRGTHPR